MESPSNSQTQQVNIIDVPVTDESVSLNLMVQFLNIAQKRGSFSIAESAKIFECIRIFINPSQQVQSTDDVGQEGELSLKE